MSPLALRPLGSTGLHVSPIAFGAGPVPAVMTAADALERQRAVVRRAIERGVNWFDTAATYGDGRSEASLGQVLDELGAADRVQIATKVRIAPEMANRIPDAVQASVAGSLERLRVRQVALLQVHNSITVRRGDQPTSLTVDDVLGRNGMLESFRECQKAGKVLHLGLTGLGDPGALREVIASGLFATVQTPYHLLNATAGQPAPAGFEETDHGQIIGDCQARGMGVFAIRVLAGGALAGLPPSSHTKTTKFFPLDLYERDRARAAKLRERLPQSASLSGLAVRFALSHPGVTSAIVGFASPEQVDEAVSACESGPLTDEETKWIAGQRIHS